MKLETPGILAADPPIREQTAADPKLTSLEMGVFSSVGYSVRGNLFSNTSLRGLIAEKHVLSLNVFLLSQRNTGFVLLLMIRRSKTIVLSRTMAWKTGKFSPGTELN